MKRFSVPILFAAAFTAGLSLQSCSHRVEKWNSPRKIAAVETTMGTFEFVLYDADAPKTSENFEKLAEKGYFKGVTFHRVSHNFVIQGGDPTGTGEGGRSIWGGSFDDELNDATASYKEGYTKGVVAMANAGPNTNTSQFFIMLVDRPDMPKRYSIFGKVISGMDVVEKIGKVPVTPQMGPEDGAPKEKVVMTGVMIRRGK
ncbi:MAG: peptidylprolyl isomerase [Ignavibacteriales bacterium CG07_land_8_20_14_0_80_59_12]|nr:MAG: peptidylprolyl isomerase [Ignavibacteriales bacterium CG07_land_8_20_14_0_80_59_12]